ncbi:unnamed protein product [Mytilus coruscus]|uniref:SGNH hydrolase-type esterase domain-containing protein n=1 Tax=Mytilus coruscus TaxID=42192 RepID=A0A6J8BMC3_MYTCO|nr:unnamed protein product [Mytilus coruscus]
MQPEEILQDPPTDERSSAPSTRMDTGTGNDVRADSNVNNIAALFTTTMVNTFTQCMASMQPSVSHIRPTTDSYTKTYDLANCHAHSPSTSTLPFSHPTSAEMDSSRNGVRSDSFTNVDIVSPNIPRNIIEDFRSTLVCDSIAKHVKTIRRCHLQAFPGANIWDIINLLNCGTIQVNYDIILMHVGTNNVGTYEVADFDIAYNVLISTIEKLVNPHTVIVILAIIPRLLDFQNTCYFVTTINSRLRSLCFKNVVQFVATYKPFFEVWDASL